MRLWNEATDVMHQFFSSHLRFNLFVIALARPYSINSTLQTFWLINATKQGIMLNISQVH